MIEQDILVVEFDDWREVEVRDAELFSITYNHPRFFVTAKIARSFDALKNALESGLKLPKGRHQIQTVSLQFNGMRLPRMCSYVEGTLDENGFRNGLSGDSFGGFTFIINCNPVTKTVTIKTSPHLVADAEKTHQQIFEAFEGFAQKTREFARSGDAITNLIRALRKTPPDEGYITRAIHEAYSQMSKQARY